jgi:heterodisulfide reductase subunit D
MGLFDRFFGKTLYYPGCVAKHLVKDVQRRHEHLLTTMDVEYVKLSEMESCCGKPALELGHKDLFNSLLNKNKELFRNRGIKRIITSCPQCYYYFKEHYDIEVKLLIEVVLENLDKLDKKLEGEIYIHDPCNPFDIETIYSVPREVLGKLGLTVKEMDKNKGESMCCGYNLKIHSPKVAEAMAKKREVKGKIVTICPACFMHLKQSGLNVVEISEVLI